MALSQWRTPVRTVLRIAGDLVRLANAFCERVIGTIRREYLDWMILLNEGHLRRVLQEWIAHYNRGRPHASLGPSIPLSANEQPSTAALETRETNMGLHTG